MQSEVETTRVSSKGQIVIPQSIRERVGFAEGDLLAVYGEEGAVVLRRIETPKLQALRASLQLAQSYAEREGLTRRELAAAIRAYRKSIQKPK